MPSTYQAYETALAPTFLANTFGAAWFNALGYVKDYEISVLKQAVKSRFPSFAPQDALSAIGIERSIIRGATEANAVYAARVQSAWDAWLWGGTPFGLLTELYAAGYTSTVIMSRSNQYTLSVSGALVTASVPGWSLRYPNGNSPIWNVFSLIIPHPWPSSWLSNGNWLTPVHIGSGGGTITPIQGTPSPDVQYCVLISTGGAVGVAQYKVSTDGGITFGSATTVAGSGNPLGGGPTFNGTGTFVLNDRYYTSQIPPADGGADSNIIRSITALWKPAHAICHDITILKTGRLIGYPVRNLGASNGVLGGCSVTAYAPPAN